ncbi:MAG: helix-turn-helix domain-containing protein [Thermodesulfobacteriota bacterium]|nr:helix-turn-helix domain-containing protein [Thermodesulfobacteriota bacterium]
MTNIVPINQITGWIFDIRGKKIMLDRDLADLYEVETSQLKRKEDLTQRQLSDLTGIPQRHISEMENGKRTTGRKNARLLVDALNIDYRGVM